MVGERSKGANIFVSIPRGDGSHSDPVGMPKRLGDAVLRAQKILGGFLVYSTGARDFPPVREREESGFMIPTEVDDVWFLAQVGTHEGGSFIPIDLHTARDGHYLVSTAAKQILSSDWEASSFYEERLNLPR